MQTFNRRLLLAFLITFPLLSSCASKRDRAPERAGYVVHAYHYCEKCQSLQGGIYEKGPFRTFPGENKKDCIHEWQECKRRFDTVARGGAGVRLRDSVALLL